MPASRTWVKRAVDVLAWEEGGYPAALKLIVTLLRVPGGNASVGATLNRLYDEINDRRPENK